MEEKTISKAAKVQVYETMVLLQLGNRDTYSRNKQTAQSF